MREKAFSDGAVPASDDDAKLLPLLVLINLGNQSAASKAYGDAIKAYEKVLHDNDKSSAEKGQESYVSAIKALRINVGNLHFEQGRYAEAIKSYQRALDGTGQEWRHVKYELNHFSLTVSETGYDETLLPL